jgi:hypothetical protein
MAKAQAEEETLRILTDRLAEQQRLLAKLIVRAPRAGKAIGRDLDRLQDLYVEKGSQLLTIGDESLKEIRLSIAQQDIAAFRLRFDAPLPTYLPACAVLWAPLTKIEPRASIQPLDATLCAPYGGPLAVRKGADSAEREGAGAYQLLAPRFTGVIPLAASESEVVRAGQRGVVAVHARETVGGHLRRRLLAWVDRKLRRP